jgi:FtsP/CotA-like multicopper oxidase with cupredoxin domain
MRSRLLGAVVATAIATTALGATAVRSDGRAPEGCVAATRSLTMYAEQLPAAPDGSIRLGYGLTPATASIPGPTIELVEGDCLALTLVNDIPASTLEALRDDPVRGDGVTPLGVSMHPHGVKYRPDSDGVPDNRWQPGSYVPPGEARTFLWYAAPRTHVGKRIGSLGTAGYWWYHDHVAGTVHGSAGVSAGLFGALVVRRPGDLIPARTFVVGMGNDATMNLRRYPDTDCAGPASPISNRCVVAKAGDRIEFVVIGLGDDFHTFHLHGHTWADTRTGVPSDPLDETRLVDTMTVGPAQTFGFQVIAGESVGVGSWMLHCHVQRHSDRGMQTFFHVTEDGSPPTPSGPGDHHHPAP